MQRPHACNSYIPATLCAIHCLKAATGPCCESDETFCAKLFWSAHSRGSPFQLLFSVCACFPKYICGVRVHAFASKKYWPWSKILSMDSILDCAARFGSWFLCLLYCNAFLCFLCITLCSVQLSLRSLSYCMYASLYLYRHE
jgi:hypothetical protein